jgi:redox-sensitive bicupin YhaK (pirin superfamily)
MIRMRPSAARGHIDHGWLDTYHTFSFGDYFDRDHMGFRSLRVLNEDRVAPGTGFGRHGHRDMEILTIVLEGELRHADSLGNGSVIRPGVLQRMSAGTGVLHSEVNPSSENPVHLLQIWILPDRDGRAPEYEERKVDFLATHGAWQLLASSDGRQGSLTVHQDVSLWSTSLSEGEAVSYDLAQGRNAWLQVVRGGVALNGHTLNAGDGAAVSAERRLEIVGAGAAEVLLFDLA